MAYSAYDRILATLDFAQQRLWLDRNLVIVKSAVPAADGGSTTGFDIDRETTTAFEPINFSGILRPYQLSDEWDTTFTGSYARLHKSDFTLTSASWEEKEIQGTGDIWLTQIGTAEPIITNVSYGGNRGFMVALFAHSVQGERFIQAETGWNNSASLSGGVGIRLWSDGTVVVFRDGNNVGQYKLSGNKTGQKNQRIPIRIFLMPGRYRELLVFSDQGDGFSHVFEGLDPTVTFITPDYKFWFSSPDAKAEVQICPLTYPTTGYLWSRVKSFPRAPELIIGDPATHRIFWDTDWSVLPGGVSNVVAEVYNEAGSAVFVPDGVTSKCRIRYTLTGNGHYTPFCYGGSHGWGYEVVNTDGTLETSLDPYITEWSLRVEDSGEAHWRIQTVDPNYNQTTLTRHDPPKIVEWSRHGNRPLKFTFAGQVVLDSSLPYGEFDQGLNEGIDVYHFEIQDPWERLEKFIFQEEVFLMGSTFNDVIEFLVKCCGLDVSFDMDDANLPLVLEVAPNGDDYGLTAAVGDNPADWIRRLFEDFAGNWMYGFRPWYNKMIFWARDPANLPTELPKIKLWEKRTNAKTDLVTAGLPSHLAEYLADSRVVRSFNEDVIPPECNDIRVTGWDPQIQQPVSAHYTDYTSQDPTIPPGSRPRRWVGDIRYYGLFDRAITSLDLAERCVTLLKDRLTTPRYMCEFDSQMLRRDDGKMIWRGDLIEIEGKGIWVITSFSVEFVKEPDAEYYEVDDGEGGTIRVPRERSHWQDRPAHYICEYVRPNA